MPEHAGSPSSQSRKGGVAGIAQEAQHSCLRLSTSVCLLSAQALTRHVGKPQPFLTFSLLPKQLQPQLLRNSWMLDLKTCSMWGLNSIGWTRGARGGGSPEPRGWGPQRGSGT